MLDEPDAAKYVWKMCVLQHTFYKMHETATENSELNITLSHPVMPPPAPDHGRAANDSSAMFSRCFAALEHGLHAGLKQSDIASFQRQSQSIAAKVELKAGHSSSKLMISNNNLFGGAKSEHSLTGYTSK